MELRGELDLAASPGIAGMRHVSGPGLTGETDPGSTYVAMVLGDDGGDEGRVELGLGVSGVSESSFFLPVSLLWIRMASL